MKILTCYSARFYGRRGDSSNIYCIFLVWCNGDDLANTIFYDADEEELRDRDYEKLKKYLNQVKIR